MGTGVLGGERSPAGFPTGPGPLGKCETLTVVKLYEAVGRVRQGSDAWSALHKLSLHAEGLEDPISCRERPARAGHSAGHTGSASDIAE